MVITQIGRKELWGNRTCLGDIMQNIAKWVSFACFPRGAWGEFTKNGLNRTNFNLSD